MESIFLILSGVILVAGVLYWLWSHIQLTQKKVQLLENAVFELRGMLANSGGGSQGPGAPVSASAVASGPSSPTRQVQVTQAAAAASVGVTRVDNDADEYGWDEHANGPTSDRMSTPLDAPILETNDLPVSSDVEDALRPGGCAMPVGLDEGVESTMDIDLDAPACKEDASAEQFRSLFSGQEKQIAVSPSSEHDGQIRTVVAENKQTQAIKTQESLESMPVKDLRRLAEQRGIAGTADMRKKDILAALRQQVSVSVSVSLHAEPEAEAEASVVAEADDGVKEIAIESAEILE